jgi:hypothetical protein
VINISIYPHLIVPLFFWSVMQVPFSSPLTFVRGVTAAMGLHSEPGIGMNCWCLMGSEVGHACLKAGVGLEGPYESPSISSNSDCCLLTTCAGVARSHRGGLCEIYTCAGMGVASTNDISFSYQGEPSVLQTGITAHIEWLLTLTYHLRFT